MDMHATIEEPVYKQRRNKNKNRDIVGKGVPLFGPCKLIILRETVKNRPRPTLSSERAPPPKTKQKLSNSNKYLAMNPGRGSVPRQTD
jgi:hypothetical protein